MRLFQIVERFPPAIDGIGDFASVLGRKLAEKYGVESKYLVLESPAPAAVPLADRSYTGGVPGLRLALLNHLRPVAVSGQSAVVLLHFNSGGFASHHLHFKLNRAITAAKRRRRARVMVFFHEVLDFRPQRRRDRWLGFLQRLAARSLVGLADGVLTSNFCHARVLRQLNSTVPISVSPVFSGVGEPDAIDFSAKAPGQWVIFGSSNRAEKSLIGLRRDLATFGPALKTKRLVVIAGAGNARRLGECLAAVKHGFSDVVFMENAPPASVSAILAQSEYFYTQYFDDEPRLDLLFKSSAFAAANAHGVMAVVGDRFAPDQAIAFGHPGVICRDGAGWTCAPGGLPDLPARLFAWYQSLGRSDHLAKIAAAALGISS